MAELINGRELSKKIKQEIKEEIVKLREKTGKIPGLAVILVGDDPASQTYVRMKGKACADAGIYSVTYKMPIEITENEIINEIERINENENIDGILVQLPLPKHINESAILEKIKISKDIDGFHPHNVGKLSVGLDGFVPCTPLGVMEMLEEYKVEIKGKNAVVVGASNIVGKPMAALLLNENATVEICHIYTDDLKKHTLNADILVVGVGKPGLIKKDMVKKGAVVIDVGTSKVDGKIVGDVEFDEVEKIASKITPVPGGVGPMTIALLLKNTLKAFKRRLL